jgi:hypothetical protein
LEPAGASVGLKSSSLEGAKSSSWPYFKIASNTFRNGRIEFDPPLLATGAGFCGAGFWSRARQLDAVSRTFFRTRPDFGRWLFN